MIPTFYFLASLLASVAGHSPELFPEKSITDSSVVRVDTLPVVELIIPTFLGNSQRNYYGSGAPDSLKLIWKHYLGSGETTISRKLGTRKWSGAGWTGQPLLVREDSGLFLIQGAFDHHLKKIAASDGRLIWQYKFDDVVKGTGTIWHNSLSDNPEERYIILQGSRLGKGVYVDAKHIPSFRAISLSSGRELWRLDVKYTGSYSRDVDASALIYNDTLFIGLENSLFTILNPDPRKASLKDGMNQPLVYREIKLFNEKDLIRHKNNVVTEASPALLGDRIYIASGSGHIFGYNIKADSLDWDFFVGSDIDGSPVVTSDSCLLVSIEKQYINGKGGVFKLDPSKPPSEAVVWYQPTGNRNFAGWEGGVIGSVAINDQYRAPGDQLMAAFCGIDGYLYVVDHQKLSGLTNPGPDTTRTYPAPLLLTRRETGASIATPLFVDDKLIVAGYGGIWLYKIDSTNSFHMVERWEGIFEATPIVFEGRVYVASRDGYLYCLGYE